MLCASAQRLRNRLSTAAQYKTKGWVFSVCSSCPSIMCGEHARGHLQHYSCFLHDFEQKKNENNLRMMYENKWCAENLICNKFEWYLLIYHFEGGDSFTPYLYTAGNEEIYFFQL